MIDRLEILISRLRRLVSRTRWSSRLLGHPAPPAHADAPGLVLIQVDGLGEKILKQALQDGDMPFLKRLVEQERHEIRSVYTGLPSNTPGFHAEPPSNNPGPCSARRDSSATTVSLSLRSTTCPVSGSR